MYNETNFHDLMFREKYYKHNKNLHYMYVRHCGMYKRELVSKSSKKIIFFLIQVHFSK